MKSGKSKKVGFLLKEGDCLKNISREEAYDLLQHGFGRIVSLDPYTVEKRL